MKVPLLDLRAQYATIAAGVEAAVKRVLESGHYILGEDVAAFERELAAATGRTHAIALSSGTDALLAAIDPRSFNLDADAALARVTDKTRAILPVHLFGRACELETLRKTGLPILEDAAQGIGLGTLGQRTLCATLSFFPSKNLGAAGDAGAVVCDDDGFADRVRLMRAHGSRPKYIHHVVGGNFRIDTIQAAILRAKLPHLTAWNQARRRNAGRYLGLLDGTPLGLPEPVEAHVWHHFVVRVPEGKRDALR